MTHETNRGYGGALRSGFEHATKELVFYTDGDGQYDVGEIPILLMLLTDDTHFVNGMKMTRQDPTHRVFIGNLHRFVTRWSFWLPINDVDCDFRLIRRSILQKISLAQQQRLDLRRAGEAGAASRRAVPRSVGPPLRAAVGCLASSSRRGASSAPTRTSP